jgi:hypothetical protein
MLSAVGYKESPNDVPAGLWPVHFWTALDRQRRRPMGRWLQQQHLYFARVTISAPLQDALQGGAADRP